VRVDQNKGFLPRIRHYRVPVPTKRSKKKAVKTILLLERDQGGLCRVPGFIIAAAPRPPASKDRHSPGNLRKEIERESGTYIEATSGCSKTGSSLGAPRNDVHPFVPLARAGRAEALGTCPFSIADSNDSWHMQDVKALRAMSSCRINSSTLLVAPQTSVVL
jgi:hypothetical protein